VFLYTSAPYHHPIKTRASRTSDYPQADAELANGGPRPLSYTFITIHFLMTASFDATYCETSSVNRPEIKSVIKFGD
jgi:hypothetical protein